MPRDRQSSLMANRLVTGRKAYRVPAPGVSENGRMISTRLAGKIRCLQATGTQQVRQFPWTYAQEFGKPGCRDAQRLPLLVEFGQSCFKSSPEPFRPFIGIALKHGSEHFFEVLRHANRDKAHGSLLNIASECGTNPEG